jgi:hypothetical protein
VNNPGITVANDLPTLFLLVTAMLCYRTLDLLSTKVKLEQVALRATWWSDTCAKYSLVRMAIRATNHNARTVLFHLKILMRIRQEFIAYMMFLYLFLFAFVGFSVLLFDAVRSGGGASFVVAIATAIVSFLTSAMNYEIEKVRIYL